MTRSGNGQMCWLDVGLAGQDEILLMNYWYSLQERIFHQQTSRFTLALHGTLGSGEEMEDQHSHHTSLTRPGSQK